MNDRHASRRPRTLLIVALACLATSCGIQDANQAALGPSIAMLEAGFDDFVDCATGADAQISHDGIGNIVVNVEADTQAELDQRNGTVDDCLGSSGFEHLASAFQQANGPFASDVEDYEAGMLTCLAEAGHHFTTLDDVLAGGDPGVVEACETIHLEHVTSLVQERSRH